MRYYDVTTSKDGVDRGTFFDHVSEMSLKSLRNFFEKQGIEVHAEYRYSIDDKPIFYKDENTGQILPNTGQVI